MGQDLGGEGAGRVGGEAKTKPPPLTVSSAKKAVRHYIYLVPGIYIYIFAGRCVHK